MTTYDYFDYLLVGAGPAAAAAAVAIRSKDMVGRILMLGAETETPYQRPPLSKGLWLGKDKEANLPLMSNADWTALKVDIVLGDPVTNLDPQQRTLSTSAGKTYHYHKSLLAMGGRPRQLTVPVTIQDRVFTLRTLADYRRLRTQAAEGGKVVVIGGGFLGAELAVALSQQQGLDVHYAVSGDGPLAQILPPVLLEKVSARYRAAGVQLETQKTLQEIRAEGGRLVVRFEDGHALNCDWVVYGIGMEPNRALADIADLKMALGGIAVDAQMRSSDPHIWAAGDLATYPDPVWGTPVRLEHWDNAEATGHAAGLAMAGETTSFAHQSLFYSDIYEFGFEAVGICRSSMECRTALSPDGAQAVIYYLQDRRVRGVLLWNVWKKADAARALIAARTEVRQASWKGPLQNW
ncbi:NAD(P)/FAD-dependent oxidoreductase [Acidithiobacillus ferriphilus]|uniref:NAD(P)/FAD-dependent oxidoreductase n=1 Tax=Acidithiobacillus ferriphilus TaxID=1689834 RepID=UPI001C60F033